MKTFKEKFIVRKHSPKDDERHQYEDRAFSDFFDAVIFATNIPKTSSKFDEVYVLKDNDDMVKVVFVPRRK